MGRPAFARTADAWLAKFGDWYVPEPNTGCWLWMGTIDKGGYGAVSFGANSRGAHRWAYKLLRGPVPDGLELDHLCRCRSCVNPDHLEPVTRRENLRRGVGFPALNARKTHCKRGHEFTPENIIPLADGGRACKTCDRTKARNWWRARHPNAKRRVQ